MIISEKQIMQLMNQLRDHIVFHEQMACLGAINKKYIDWLRELREEITNQQSEELRGQLVTPEACASCCSVHTGTTEECLIEPECWTYKEYSAGLCGPLDVNKPKFTDTQSNHDEVDSEECQHESQTPGAPYRVHMCTKCSEEFVIECQNESNGVRYSIGIDQGYNLKCKKCGKFYP